MTQQARNSPQAPIAFGENTFRAMFHIASVGMAIIDTAEMRLLDVNDKYCQITGYTRDELIGMRVTDLMHPDDRHGVAERQAQALSGQATQHLTEKRYVRKDGAVVWVRVNSAYLREGPAGTVRAVVVYEDITARVQAESALIESRRRLRALLDGMPDRVVLKDPQGRIVAANISQARDLGAANVKDVIGKTLADFRPAAFAREVMQEDQEVLRADAPLRIERQMPSGVWFDVVKVPIRDYSGAQSGVVTIARDITERKRMEDELRETEHRLRDSEGKLRALLDTIPDRAWLKDTQGRYVAANRAAAEFFGLTPAQMAGKTSEDLFPPEEAKAINEEEREVLLSLKPLRTEREFGGQGRWYETIKLPIRGADGAVAGLVVIARDVTDRRQAENELREAKAAAEQANRAKGEFLSHMSHEMRTPMNAILGFAEIALLEQPDPSQVEHLEKITAATKSLLRVIDDVLDFERVDAGKLALESLDFRIDDVIQNVRDVIERAANAKGLALRFKVGENMPPRLKGDAARVGQVLMNLCANALKFTSHGFIEVVVEAQRVANGNVTLRFEVRDTGIGMSAEEQARLFQPFMQADISTTRRFGGTGLGLAICKRLVELMGGRIWIESEPGEGTVVFFTLNCALGESLAAAGGGAHEGLPEEAAALDGKRVLVVDDHPINRMLMAKLLKLAGAQAVPAENGVDALRVLESQGKVDLVLMDLRMPEMDGYEATRRIRADARWKNMPIVAVTASAATYERARCMAVGMNDVIVKPIHQSTFFPVVAAAMRAQRAAAENP